MIGWLLDGDPAICWQVLRDLTDAPAGEVAAGRARVEYDGWGARLLAREGPGGLWDGGACFPASWADGEPGQPWTATMHTLQTLQILGLDPASASVRRAIGLVAENGRWEHAGQRFFDGEVEPCINGRTIETGAYFGVDVAAVVARVLAGRLADGGWNCEAENGSVRSSFDTTISVLDGLAAPAALSAGGCPGDEAFTALTARRPVAESVLARVAADAPGITVRRGAAVTRLVTGAPAAAGVCHVAGVGLQDGTELRADLVVDATGRRSRLPGLLSAIGAPLPIEEREDCGFVYYARHFRGPAGSIPEVLGPILQDYGSISSLTLPADNGTWGVGLITSARDKAARALKDTAC